jgi:hypothetical protein
MLSKTKNIIGVLIVVVLVVFFVNELRFFIWPSFGVPEMPTMPNCGERRFKYNYQIKSKESFLDIVDKLRKIYQGEPGFIIAQNFRFANFTLSDITERDSGSILFNEKIYGVTIPYCKNLIVEISENGYASERGCCGI